jgi:curved DNA-binding protein CbpA
LKTRAADPAKPQIKTEEEAIPEVTNEEKAPEVKLVSLDEYLERVEKADTYYEVLGIGPDSRLPAIRASYFSLAKMFHPDRFHRAESEVLHRVEGAFTRLAQAHETLRNPETRIDYDKRMSIDLAERNRRDSSGATNVPGNYLNAERAVQEFEHGRSLLMDEDFEAALPFLARAVHLAPDNARYHAFFGKALSSDAQNRHKAEAEMQAAVKLEPSNAAFRMMLAEFFVRMKLAKRAEGELNRLLTLFPDHKDAISLLDSLQQK